jgi:hypothetical protein
MEQITIQVRSRVKARWLAELLRSLDFVESVETVQNGAETDDAAITSDDREQQFLDLAGVWADRDITLQSLRRQAWPK